MFAPFSLRRSDNTAFADKSHSLLYQNCPSGLGWPHC